MIRLRVIAVCIAGSLLSASVVLAQPAGGTSPVPVPPPAVTPDFARAAELYKAAERAMTESRFDDAARDYGSAYEITRDSLLFFKIASAHDKAGRCPVALTYYRRYLKEAKPTPEYMKLTQGRIAACEKGAPGAATDTAIPTGSSGTSGTDATNPNHGSSIDATIGTGTDATATGAIDPTTTAAPTAIVNSATKTHTTSAWIATGTGIAFATVGAVLALSAKSTQDDLTDLLATRTPGGQPPAFDGITRRRYDDLITTGERYQTLSWISFGVAGAAGIAATYLFLTSESGNPERSPGAASVGKTLITPTIGRNFASVSATLRF